MAEQKRFERAFKAVMSRGDDIPLDPGEIALVQQGIESRSVVRVRQGIINPSFLISIVEDKERRRAFLDDSRHDEKRKDRGMVPLADLLSDTPQLPPGR